MLKALRFPTPQRWVSAFRHLPGLLRFSRRPAHCIGLDIGSSSIKGVKLAKGPQGFTLVERSVVPLSPEAASPERVQAIQQVLKSLDGRGAPVITAVGGPGTVLRSVPFPRMTRQELKTALSFEAEKHIPFKPEEAFLDSWILGDQPGGRMEVLLAAARKELVNAHCELLKSAGIVPQAVDLEPVALANAWEISHPPSETEAVGLIHVGARATILNFLSGTRLVFTREMPYGGAAFTQAVAEGLKIDVAEAGRLKCEPGSRLNEVRAALQPAWDEWLAQCRVSLDFYENQFGHGVGRLYLSGGSAPLAGFKEAVQEATALSTEIWDPLSGLKRTAGSPGPEGLSVALGLAVGCAARGLS
ncbi:MAG: type IV pilus assembly protein PilM [Candidatus Omnitrophica bacterium]|nr:type IV pilus assembly protein PilM [Candidatus Omnitrophota bacterium]